MMIPWMGVEWSRPGAEKVSGSGQLFGDGGVASAVSRVRRRAPERASRSSVTGG